MDNNAIVLNNIEKVYPLYQNTAEKLLGFFFPLNFSSHFYALRDISFSVEKGNSVALLGMNGSGKSTLANIIAGVSAPSKGTLSIDGEVSMTSISGGLNPQLTGEENIIQKCLLIGLHHNEIKELMPEIIEFSELGSFIKQPTKTYSSGMRSKLAFSISANIDPDVLVIDEALSVGDPTFTQKCLSRMKRFQERGKTIIFVSHSIPQVRDFCDRAVWLEGGKIREIGECNEITTNYGKFIKDFNALSPNEQMIYKDNIRNSRTFISRKLHK